MVDDLRHFAAGVDKRRLAVALCTTAAVMLFVAGSWQFGNSIAAPQVQPSSYPPAIHAGAPAEAATTAAAHYASIVAACMNGDQFLWIDPHTGKHMAAFCDVYDLSVAEWRKVK